MSFASNPNVLYAKLTRIHALRGLGKAAALALACPTVDLPVTQVANGVWGVHAVLPDGARR